MLNVQDALNGNADACVKDKVNLVNEQLLNDQNPMTVSAVANSARKNAVEMAARISADDDDMYGPINVNNGEEGSISVVVTALEPQVAPFMPDDGSTREPMDVNFAEPEEPAAATEPEEPAAAAEPEEPAAAKKRPVASKKRPVAAIDKEKHIITAAVGKSTKHTMDHRRREDAAYFARGFISAKAYLTITRCARPSIP